MNTNRNFTDQHRATLLILLHMDKELLELYSCLRQVKPKGYPMFPKGDKMDMYHLVNIVLGGVCFSFNWREMGK